MKPSWFIEIATNLQDDTLAWQQASLGSVIYEFGERDRRRAENIAIELACMLDGSAVIRVRHAQREKRGCFLPRPRPARVLCRA